MHIVVLDDYHERELLRGDLRKSFPNAQVTETGSVGEFLRKLPDLLTDFVLILEHYLPLMEVGTCEEEMESNYHYLVTNFPLVARDWSHQKAAERTIRHLRANNRNVPVIIYTHSDLEWIEEDVRADPQVRYLEKRGEEDEYSRLKEAICSLRPA